MDCGQYAGVGACMCLPCAMYARDEQHVWRGVCLPSRVLPFSCGGGAGGEGGGSGGVEACGMRIGNSVSPRSSLCSRGGGGGSVAFAEHAEHAALSNVISLSRVGGKKQLWTAAWMGLRTWRLEGIQGGA